MIDSINPSALAPFWCAMLDTTVDTTLGGGEFLVLSPTTRELEGFIWRCMADPEGNEFDIDVLPPA